MNGKSLYMVVPPPAPGLRSVQDEWGMFDPNQAGLKAAFRAARALTRPAVDDKAPESADRDDSAASAVHDGAEDLHVGATEPIVESVPEPVVPDSPVQAAPAVHADPAAPEVSDATANDENIYDLTAREPTPPRATPVSQGAVYTLEFPTRCPQCSAEIATVRVSRLLRTQVSFTSTLPRKGYIIVCPLCEGILSAELSGLI